MAGKTAAWVLMSLFSAPVAAGAAEIYQWTDAGGVVHFTDDLTSVPREIRRSAALRIRTMEEPKADRAPEEIPVFEPERIPVATPEEPRVPEPVIVNYAPGETTIIVVNSGARKRPHRCRGDCGFRPNFFDRRYIHPSVFNGGSRQYIQPK
ncbi:MAG TPA: DUF4124 domain-containing protein [candidate division Zixibacteria bacterium]|nr:DUF4124 domain-containing protein [candidate division Zixibacteria bacterium]